MSDTPSSQADRLVQQVHSYGACVIAFSGGVDSAVVAQAAFLAFQADAIAVTAVSPSLASGELEIAKQVARQIGIRHETISTSEMNSIGYRTNQGDRCYYCKSELYQRLADHRQRWEVDVIVNGTNFDDLGDHRPGLQAAVEHHVRSPLVELEFGKPLVRDLARWWNLSVAEKPASPCLASRIAYGQIVSVEKLQRIDAAEQLLKARGFDVVRVRLLSETHARIEVAQPRLAELRRVWGDEKLESQFQRLGFQRIEIDPEGFRSGRMNDELVELRSSGRSSSSSTGTK